MTARNRAARKQGSGSRRRAAPERLHKVLARAGLGSRRAMEQAISAGRVELNGTPATTGTSVSGGETVAFDGRRFEVQAGPEYHQTLIYNKPAGEVTTRSDPQGRRTVFDRLPAPKKGRWIAVGRLDINTTGLLLLTTDGELANTMMHPSGQVDREYACRIHGRASDASLAALLRGVKLDDGEARFTDLVASGGSGENQWYHATLMEGRNREVRRLWESQGVQVSALMRVRYGAAFLPEDLKRGEFRELSNADHRILREDVGLAPSRRVLRLEPLDNSLRRPPRKKAAKRPAAPRKTAPRKTPSRKATPGKNRPRRRATKKR